MTRSSPMVLVALACGLLLAGCGGGSGDDATAAPALPEVTVARVQRGTLTEGLTVTGNLAALPNRDARLAPLVPGRIAAVLVSEGDAVQAGQALAELDSSSLKDQERQAEAAVAQARANFENAQIAAQRSEGLLQRGIAARKEVEDARTQVSVDQAALAQAEAGLSAARTQVARGVVRAPFAGTVVHRFLGVGEQVDGSAVQPVVEVANIQTLELLGNVPASRLSEVHTGEQFSFQTAAAPGEDFTGTVAAVLPAVDPATDNGTLRIRINNPKRLLKLGMFLSLSLPVKPAASALIVPRQAIYPDESGAPRVYRVVGDQAQAVSVTLGAQTQDKTEVLSGLQEGDTVIVTGGYGLPDTAKVRVK